jgi:hypothetical protein
MGPKSLVTFALAVGLLAGHGFEIPIDLLPLIAVIVIGFLAIKAAEFTYDG